jgi:hypothetical protein
VGFENTVNNYSQFGFEDITGGGDLGYDDVVYNIALPLQPLSEGPCSRGVGLGPIVFKGTEPNGTFPTQASRVDLRRVEYVLSYAFNLAGSICPGTPISIGINTDPSVVIRSSTGETKVGIKGDVQSNLTVSEDHSVGVAASDSPPTLSVIDTQRNGVEASDFTLKEQREIGLSMILKPDPTELAYLVALAEAVAFVMAGTVIIVSAQALASVTGTLLLLFPGPVAVPLQPASLITAETRMASSEQLQESSILSQLVIDDLKSVFGAEFINLPTVDSLTIDSSEKRPGQDISYSGSKFTPNSRVYISLTSLDDLGSAVETEASADGNGVLEGKIRLSETAKPGRWLLTAIDIKAMYNTLQNFANGKSTNLQFYLAANTVTVSPEIPPGATISVPGNQPWTDTGIDLNQGDQVTITASGTIKIEPSDPGKTPAGDPSCIGPTGRKIDPTSETWLTPGLTCWSLVGRIGDGAPFQIGTSLSFPVETGGRLYLGVNDENGRFGNNSGSWTVDITVGDAAAETDLVANAGPDQTVPGPSPVAVQFDGSGSTGDIVRYQWYNQWGLLRAEGMTPVIEVNFGYNDPKPGIQRTFILVVEDSQGNTAQDQVTITLGETAEEEEPLPPEDQPTIILDPAEGAPGAEVTATGSGWPAGHEVSVQWEDGTELATPTVDGNGDFTVSFTVPDNAAEGQHTIDFVGFPPEGEAYVISAIFTVTAPAETPPPKDSEVYQHDFPIIEEYTQGETGRYTLEAFDLWRDDSNEGDKNELTGGLIVTTDSVRWYVRTGRAGVDDFYDAPEIQCHRGTRVWEGNWQGEAGSRDGAGCLGEDNDLVGLNASYQMRVTRYPGEEGKTPSFWTIEIGDATGTYHLLAETGFGFSENEQQQITAISGASCADLLELPPADNADSTCATAPDAQPTITLDPTEGPPDTEVTATGSRWPAGHEVNVQWEDGTVLATTTVDDNGDFTVSFSVPDDATEGEYTIDFVSFHPDGGEANAIPATFFVTTPASPSSGPAGSFIPFGCNDGRLCAMHSQAHKEDMRIPTIKYYMHISRIPKRSLDPADKEHEYNNLKPGQEPMIISKMQESLTGGFQKAEWATVQILQLSKLSELIDTFVSIVGGRANLSAELLTGSLNR